jgi:hypothetical protein
MGTTTAWSITRLDAYPQVGPLTDVVVTAHWCLTGTDGVYVARTQGAVSFALEPDQPFTPYDELTEEQVVGWVQGVFGPAYTQGLEDNITREVELLANPPIVTPPLPWATVEEGNA